jgi:hypothetical protein
MLLRESGTLAGESYDLSVITEKGSGGGGVPHGETLLGFTEAVMGDDEAVLDRSRQEVLEKLGPEQLVDAAGVAATFNMMDRIADSTGIPLDGPLDFMTVDMRTEMGLDQFPSAANTPKPSALKRVLSRALKPVAPLGMKIMLAMQGKPQDSKG